MAESAFTVLAVDDDVNFLRILEIQLQSLEFPFVSALSADDALSKFLANPRAFHVLLTDVIMSESNGWDLSQAILAENPQVKVIYVSSAPRTQIVAQYGWPIPADAFLKKPIPPETLRDKIVEMVTRD